MSSKSIENFEQTVDCWLLVWVGPGDWQSRVGGALETVKTLSDDAHYILSREIEGDRWSLLLVHYSETERDFVVNQLRDFWNYGFVNAVLDLKERD